MPQCVGLSCRFSGRRAGCMPDLRSPPGASYLVPSARVHESAAAPFPLGRKHRGPTGWGGSGFFPGRAAHSRGTVQNPGALRGRLGAGVVAYVPLIRALVTLSRAPRETALFQVHCCHSSLPGRYASAAYTPVCGGTTGNMPRIPAGVPGCCGYVAGRPRRSSSVRCFGMVRTGSPCFASG